MDSSSRSVPIDPSSDMLANHLPIVAVNQPLHSVEDYRLIKVGTPGGVPDEEVYMNKIFNNRVKFGALLYEARQVINRLLALDEGGSFPEMNKSSAISLARRFTFYGEYYRVSRFVHYSFLPRLAFFGKNRVHVYRDYVSGREVPVEGDLSPLHSFWLSTGPSARMVHTLTQDEWGVRGILGNPTFLHL